MVFGPLRAERPINGAAVPADVGEAPARDAGAVRAHRREQAAVAQLSRQVGLAHRRRARAHSRSFVGASANGGANALLTRGPAGGSRDGTAFVPSGMRVGR